MLKDIVMGTNDGLIRDRVCVFVYE